MNSKVILSSIFSPSDIQDFEAKFYETGSIYLNPFPQGLVSFKVESNVLRYHLVDQRVVSFVFFTWKMLESNPDSDVLYIQKSWSSEQLAMI